MSIESRQPILTRKERTELAKLVREHNRRRRKQNPTGKVVGIKRIPNSPKIVEFFAKVTKRRRAEAAGAPTA